MLEPPTHPGQKVERFAYVSKHDHHQIGKRPGSSL
jgi:hypothetical protein